MPQTVMILPIVRGIIRPLAQSSTMPFATLYDVTNVIIEQQ
jgi:hypothetical protein